MARRYRPIDVGEKIVLGDQHSNDGIKWHATLGGGHTFGDPDVTMPPFYRRPLKKGERWPTSANNARDAIAFLQRAVDARIDDEWLKKVRAFLKQATAPVA